MAGFQRGLVNVELVGIHGALDHGFAQAPARGDEHRVAETRFGIQREHDAAGATVGAHHDLDARRQRPHCCAQSPGERGRRWRGRCKGRRTPRESALPCTVSQAADIEEGFLLAGKGGIRQIFGRCRRAHSDRRFAASLLAQAFSRLDRWPGSRAGWKGVSIIHRRMSPPATPASSRTSSTSRAAGAPGCVHPGRTGPGIRERRRRWLRIRQGTSTPRSDNWLIISPREAFLPPTRTRGRPCPSSCKPCYIVIQGEFLISCRTSRQSADILTGASHIRRVALIQPGCNGFRICNYATYGIFYFRRNGDHRRRRLATAC